MHTGYLLTLKDKEFLYEIYRSQYDDKGKLIAEAAAAGKKTMGLENTAHEQRQNEGITQVAGKVKLGAGAALQNLNFLEINYKYVQLDKLDVHKRNDAQSKLKIILEMEKDIETQEDLAKSKGMLQVEEQFLVNIIMTNLKAWKDLWRTIRQVYDSDKNGFVGFDELDEMFRKFYPKQLEGKALNVLFKQFESAYDKSLLNYKKLREVIGKVINDKLILLKMQPDEGKTALHTE